MNFMNSLRLVIDKNDKINNYKVKNGAFFCKIGIKVKLSFQMHKILSTFKRILFPIHNIFCKHNGLIFCERHKKV
jgi:hypothetical protein